MKSTGLTRPGTIINPGEKKLRNWVAAAPFIFALHFLEEAPGFVEWANGYVDVDITQEFFLGVNLFVLFVTSLVAVFTWATPSPLTAVITTLWLGFMMMANAGLHVGAGILESGYVPGLVTAVVLYIPYYLLLMVRIVRQKFLGTWTVVALTVIASAPMAVHGYLILFLEVASGNGERERESLPANVICRSFGHILTN